MRVSDYVFQYLKSIGVEHVFVLPGGGAMHLDDSLGQSGIPYTAVLHEQAGSIAAYAYSMYHNSIGIMLCTSGPGGTNCITGCSNAWAESIPVLFISGQAKRETLINNHGVRQMGSQEVDIVSIVESITKYAKQVCEPDKIRYELEKAVYFAKSGRPGPVWLDIPVDVQGSQVNELSGYTRPTPYQHIIREHVVDKAREVAVLLQNSTRPVLLAGYGIQAAGAEDDFRKLVDVLGVPVLTTWKEMGILPDDHPLYIGRPGKIGQRASNFTQQNCDLLISIGARLDFEQTAFRPRHFAFKAKKVVVDADNAEIAKLDMDIDVKIACDAGEFIRELLKVIQPVNNTDWLTRCQEWKKKYPVALPEYHYSDDMMKVNSYAFMDDLSEAASENDVLAPGSSGQSVEVFMQGWKVKQGQKFIFAPALGPMGFDIPMALGACIASGKRRTICTTGDGGFQLNLPTLETIRCLNLPVKFFVFCNGGYGSIMSMQRNYFNGRFVGSNPESGLTFPALDKIAETYNIQYYKIMTGLKSKDTIKKILAHPGPVICEVAVDENTVQQPRVSSHVENGVLVSDPMEDLYPYLPRDEFEEAMK